jgi:pimeloyl-ACP methyl ester carboxylesterase
MNQTHYRLRVGERVPIDAPSDVLDFVRNAKSRSVKINGAPANGFVVGSSISGEVLLAASLTTQPGEYTVTVSATNEVGEERSAAVNVTLIPLETVPSSATRPPVVLLNGWQPGIGGCPPSVASKTFGLTLETGLLNDHVPVVYFFDNCVEDVNGQKIEDLGASLGLFLGLIRYDTGALVPQVDLVGHSMGGLIIRSYLAGLRADGSLLAPIDSKVRKVIQIATPNFGSFRAVGLGPQTAEMVPGSSFLWNLATWNQRADDLRGVDALAVIGNGGFPANASDGVVSVSSASLGFARDPTRTRILPYCHTDSNPIIDCNGSGIAKAPETQDIIRSFLANTSAWQSIGTTPPQDPTLSKYGGMYFAYATASNQLVNDLTSVSFGTVPLSSGTVFYQDFVSGTDTFHVTRGSLGGFNCGPFSEPVGYYSV